MPYEKTRISLSILHERQELKAVAPLHSRTEPRGVAPNHEVIAATMEIAAINFRAKRAYLVAKRLQPFSPSALQLALVGHAVNSLRP